MSKKKYIGKIIVFIGILLICISSVVLASGAQDNVIFLRDGGNGDGSSYETPAGDFKEAVRSLAQTGGKIVICGKYTYSELITLSSKSGTANRGNTITVTSVYGEKDYRVTDNAMLCAGNEHGSANMILCGNFVFENLTIVTDGSKTPRAIVCGGYSTTFGEGIVCKKQGDAPYISVVGISFGEVIEAPVVQLTVKSGTYNYVCAGNRGGTVTADTVLVIDGGTFESYVSATGAFPEFGGRQIGNSSLIINGGTFYGDVGTVTELLGDFNLTVNGGIFRKNVIAYGIYNTVDINGGNLQSVGKILIKDYIAPAPETNEDGETAETEESDVKITSVNVNSYSGEVKKLVEKIDGEGVVVNINTAGGSDIDTGNSLQTTEITVEENSDVPGTAEESGVVTEREEQVQKNYFLGSRNATVIAAIGFGVVIFISIVLLAYRTVYRKK